MIVLPAWLDHAVLDAKYAVGIYDGMRIESTAFSSARDLERLAAETVRTNCPLTAATNLFGGAR